MAELADAHGLGPCAARRAGSSPVPGTKFGVPTTCLHHPTGKCVESLFQANRPLVGAICSEKIRARVLILQRAHAGNCEGCQTCGYRRRAPMALPWTHTEQSTMH
jgi:hypothetical protein